MARAEGDVVITVGGNVSPLTDAVTKAERTMGNLSKSTKRADAEFRAMVASSTTLQARINALTGVTERTGKSVEKAAKEFEGFERSRRAVDQLRASYDPLFAASKRYEAAVEELDSALSLGVITQSQYAQMTQKLATSMMTLDGQQRGVSKGSNQLTMQVQNASYQVGDFFVQIASGTDATRALAQQLPQLLGGFGMFGAVAGAAAAIGGALIPMFIGATEKAKSLDEQTNDLAASVARYGATVKALKMPLEQMVEKYGTLSLRARELNEALKLSAEWAVMAQATSMVDALTESLLRGRMAGFGHTAEMRALRDETLAVGDASNSLRNALNALAKAEGVKAQYEAAMQVLAALDAIKSSTGQLTAAQQQLYTEIAKIADELAQISGITDDATGATYAWASAMASVKAEINGIAAAIASIGGGMIDNAAKFAELNARKAGQSKAEAVRARKMVEIEGDYQEALAKAGSFSEKGAAWTNKMLSEAGLRADEELAALDAAEREASKKGGGGKGDREGERAKRDLERLQQDFMSEQELLAVQYEERLIGLQDARANELLTEEQYNALKLQAQADFNEKMRGLDHEALQGKLAAWSGAFGDLSSLMNTSNKKLFKLGKMAAIAQATVDGWSSATSAYKKGTEIGGPKVGAIFAAMSLAKTGAMLASIKSTQFEGGGGSAGGGSAAVAAPAESQAKVANYQISGDVLGKQSTAELFRSINEGIKDGYTIHNVEWVA